MKYTGKTRSGRRNKKSGRRIALRAGGSVLFCLAVVLTALYIRETDNAVLKFEASCYASSVCGSPSLFADDLCVPTGEVEFEEFDRHDQFHGALLFNIRDNIVLYSEHAYDRLYPASTTKLMTAYLALKYGNLSDVVEVSENAVNVPSDSSTAHLEAGDKLTLEDLLYALMLPSGNDSAVAIAEYISGSAEEFANLMNREANLMGATHTHFVNPHGYHDDDHYTTAYDLYLILNSCIKNEKFVEIISSQGRSALITKKNGDESVAVTWTQSNKFVNGSRKAPEGITVIGGKTGTTYEAGYCLALYGKDAGNVPYISVIMGATSSRNLYDNMTNLWVAIPD